jgi:5-formyltetrahydrofolate cyclo-ligase
MNPLQEKEKIRFNIKKIRNTLTEREIKNRSNKIKNTIYNMTEFKIASTILFYVSYGSEVYTHDMIKECILSEKKVVVPKTILENEKLTLSELLDWNHLELGAYNILEPKDEYLKEIQINSIDLFLIPGVVFDLSGNRIGHGKGYYDKLLKKEHSVSYFGLAFEDQIVDKIPIESHDVMMDKIVTDKRVIDCKKTR